MTCEDCEAIVIELARAGGGGAPAEVAAAERDEARRHAALCSRCGEMLQEQLWVSEQLRAFAADDAAAQAPARVEIAVLAAWRAHHGQGAAPASTTPVVAFEQPRRAARWMMPSIGLAGLAAAAMALFFVWSNGHRAPAGVGVDSMAATQPRATGIAQPQPRQMEPSGAVAQREGQEPAAEAPSPRVETMMARADIGTRSDVGLMYASATSTDNEFLPLPYVEPLRSTEARHVVRVSMSSSDEMVVAMLPTDRRTGDTIEADVLVGEDGIARAIRIVR
jgi:hypothetical protein